MTDKEYKPLTSEEVQKKRERLVVIEETLKDQNKKGFRKLSTKKKNELEQEHKNINQLLATDFLPKYQALVKEYGIEVRAIMETNPYQPNIAQAVTRLMPYKEQKKNTKPWHEAMADNLKTRGDCEHVEHAEGELCEKCGLVKSAWGKDGKGVTHEYFTKQRERIEEEKKKQEEADKEE